MEESEILISLLENLQTLEGLMMKSYQQSIHLEIQKTLKNELIEVMNLEMLVKNCIGKKQEDADELRIIKARKEFQSK